MPSKTLGDCDAKVLKMASIGLTKPREHALGKPSNQPSPVSVTFKSLTEKSLSCSISNCLQLASCVHYVRLVQCQNCPTLVHSV